MKLIADNDKTVTTTKTDLYFYSLMYLLTFKKSSWLQKQIKVLEEELEAIKDRRIY